MSNASASGMVLWGEVVTAGVEDVSGTDRTGTAGKVSPSLSPNKQKPLSGTARKLGSIVMQTHTYIMGFWSGEEHSNQIKRDLLTAGHPIIFSIPTLRGNSTVWDFIFFPLLF